MDELTHNLGQAPDTKNNSGGPPRDSFIDQKDLESMDGLAKRKDQTAATAETAANAEEEQARAAAAGKARIQELRRIKAAEKTAIDTAAALLAKASIPAATAIDAQTANGVEIVAPQPTPQSLPEQAPTSVIAQEAASTTQPTAPDQTPPADSASVAQGDTEPPVEAPSGELSGLEKLDLFLSLAEGRQKNTRTENSSDEVLNAPVESSNNQGEVVTVETKLADSEHALVATEALDKLQGKWLSRLEADIKSLLGPTTITNEPPQRVESNFLLDQARGPWVAVALRLETGASVVIALPKYDAAVLIDVTIGGIGSKPSLDFSDLHLQVIEEILEIEIKALMETMNGLDTDILNTMEKVTGMDDPAGLEWSKGKPVESTSALLPTSGLSVKLRVQNKLLTNSGDSNWYVLISEQVSAPFVPEPETPAPVAEESAAVNQEQLCTQLIVKLQEHGITTNIQEARLVVQSLEYECLQAEDLTIERIIQAADPEEAYSRLISLLSRLETTRQDLLAAYHALWQERAELLEKPTTELLTKHIESLNNDLEEVRTQYKDAFGHDSWEREMR